MVFELLKMKGFVQLVLHFEFPIQKTHGLILIGPTYYLYNFGQKSLPYYK